MRRDIEHFTTTQRELTRRRRRRRRYWFGLFVLAGLVYLASFFVQRTQSFQAEVDHFKFGSIGSETRSGIPKDFWLALPHLYPEEFDRRDNFEIFGFLYGSEETAGHLPIGVSERRVSGVDMVWLNCAACHTGSYKEHPQGPEIIVAGMPANQLELSRFTKFILSLSDDPLEPESVFKAMDDSGNKKNWIQEIFWRWIILPRIRDGIGELSQQLSPLLALQPDWGIGRVDTFNPYKMTQFNIDSTELASSELVGASDFPSIFLQRDRKDMQLHWDGNNNSLKERNLSASLGAGVFPDTVDHQSVNRVANWLLDLEPPPNPHRSNTYSQSVKDGYGLYKTHCAACHGYFDLNKNKYVFKGQYLGQVDPIENVKTDRNRLDSYTTKFRDRQVTELFAGTEHQFKHFTKTNGYANGPLDGLWLRGPYLHNGSVPTLWDLLSPPQDRPSSFMRNSNVLDKEYGGFLSPACTNLSDLNCFDTNVRGNSNRGHKYGTDLVEKERQKILDYLKTF